MAFGGGGAETATSSYADKQTLIIEIFGHTSTQPTDRPTHPPNHPTIKPSNHWEPPEPFEPPTTNRLPSFVFRQLAVQTTYRRGLHWEILMGFNNFKFFWGNWLYRIRYLAM